MNEHGLPPDELASAFLDDELAESAADAVRSDPELTARVDELRQVSDAVGAPVTPPPGAEDAAVAAALADFDARRTTTLEPARQRSRRLSLITGVAAAVAIGFIVAAAVGLFSEREAASDAETSVAAAPPPAPEAAPAPAPEPPPPAEPAPADSEAMQDIQAAEAMAAEALAVAEAAQAAGDLAQATAEGNEAAVAAAEATLAEAQAVAESARAEASAAQAEADSAREAAAAAQSEAAAAQSEAAAAAEPEPAPPPAVPPPLAEPPPPAPAAEIADPEALPADDGDMPADDMSPPADVDTGLPPESCAAAVGDGRVALRITAGETPVLIIHTIDERFVALDGTTCGEIPPEPPDTVYPLPSESCVAAVGDGRVALAITVGETPVLIIHTIDGRLAGLGGDTCSYIPPTEPG